MRSIRATTIQKGTVSHHHLRSILPQRLGRVKIRQQLVVLELHIQILLKFRSVYKVLIFFQIGKKKLELILDGKRVVIVSQFIEIEKKIS